MALLVLTFTPLFAALASLTVRRSVRPLELITVLAAPVECGRSCPCGDCGFY